jgi:hypothetical protein
MSHQAPHQVTLRAPMSLATVEEPRHAGVTEAMGTPAAEGSS